MKVKAVIRFMDREAETIREAEEEFTADDARAEKLIGLGFVEEVPGKAKAEKTEKG